MCWIKYLHGHNLDAKRNIYITRKAERKSEAKKLRGRLLKLLKYILWLSEMIQTKKTISGITK